MKEFHKLYDSQLVHIADVVHFLKKRKKVVFLAGVLSTCLTLIFLKGYEPASILKASFKDAKIMKADISQLSLLKNLFQNETFSADAQANSIMTSRNLLKEVIEKVHMQGQFKYTNWLDRYLKKTPKGILINSLRYEGDVAKSFSIEKGRTSYIFDDVILELEKNEIEEPITIVIEPVQKVMHQILKQLRIKKRQDDSNILDLTYKDVDLQRGICFLDTLMATYKEYLIQDSKQLAQMQLEYLEKRQNAISKKLEKSLEEHMHYLETHVSEEGFLGLYQELEMLDSKKREQEQRLLEISLDLDRLSQARKSKLFSFTTTAFGGEDNTLQRNLLDLKKNKQELHLKLRPSFFDAIAKKKEDIDQQYHSLIPLVAELKQSKYQQKGNYFEGLDLENARRLYREYLNEKDQLHIQETELIQALELITKKSSALTPLITLLHDSLSQETLKELIHIEEELKKEKYLSEKDESRLIERFHMKNAFLQKHLEGMRKVMIQSRTQLESKIEVLKSKMDELIDEEIGIIEAELDSIYEERSRLLQIERTSLEKKMQSLQEQLKVIPRKWLVENKMQLESDVNIHNMEGLATLIESKNIEHHFLQVESKPLDEAYVPHYPKTLSYFMYLPLGTLLGVAFAIALMLIIQLFKGFPVSVASLKYRGLSTISLSRHQRELEKIAAILAGQKNAIIGAVLNGQKDYTGVIEQKLISIHKKVHRIPITDPAVIYTEAFEDLLKMWTGIYDTILLVLESTPDSIFSQKLKNFCHTVLITLDEENIDDLYPYISWEKQTDNASVIYLALE